MPAGMLIAAAVCPHPPLLIPEATGAPGSGDAELRYCGAPFEVSYVVASWRRAH